MALQVGLYRMSILANPTKYYSYVPLYAIDDDSIYSTCFQSSETIEACIEDGASQTTNCKPPSGPSGPLMSTPAVPWSPGPLGRRDRSHNWELHG